MKRQKIKKYQQKYQVSWYFSKKYQVSWYFENVSASWYFSYDVSSISITILFKKSISISIM